MDGNPRYSSHQHDSSTTSVHFHFHFVLISRWLCPEGYAEFSSTPKGRTQAATPTARRKFALEARRTVLPHHVQGEVVVGGWVGQGISQHALKYPKQDAEQCRPNSHASPAFSRSSEAQTANHATAQGRGGGGRSGPPPSTTGGELRGNLAKCKGSWAVPAGLMSCLCPQITELRASPHRNSVHSVHCTKIE